MLTVLGCASKPLGVRPVDQAERFRRENANVLTSDDVSESTRAFLDRNLLDGNDLPALHARLLERKERVLAFHLAEITFARGKGAADPGEAAKCFLSSAAYAYAFLFDPTLGPPPTPYDPAFRWSCDVYNRALARVVAHAAERRAGRQQAFRLAALHAELDVERGRTELSWAPESYERVLVCSGFEVTGVAHRARDRGLGVAVIAIREPPGMARPEADRFLPPVRLAHAGTILARFEGLPEYGGVQRGSVEILDPMQTTTVRIGEEEVPIEIDITTPIAYMLEQGPDYSGLDAMLHGEQYEKHAELFMLQPYRPDRIPVVFVHGLMSSPMTWAGLLNEMSADPVLRERCQFWFFRYPTGYPILYSAALLREALRTAARTYDPDGRNPAFQNMVLCSHSMGGLVSKLQVHTGKGRLWSVFSETPIGELGLAPEEEDLLRSAFEFERLPFVSRVVFMAVPHRGAELATGFVGWLGTSMIEEPRKIEVLPGALRTRLREEYRSVGVGELRRATTGIGNLSPENPVQREIVTWPYPSDVTVHSIIGNEDAAEPGGTDGIVAYWSSHLDGVASETVVKSGHGVHWNMAAIAEVRRILRLHVEQVHVAPGGSTVRPAATEPRRRAGLPTPVRGRAGARTRAAPAPCAPSRG